MVFQNYALYLQMTVAENLAFGLKMRQTDAKTQQVRVETTAKVSNRVSVAIVNLRVDRLPKQIFVGAEEFLEQNAL